jgi:Protein of unknown function (DUF992)
MPTQFLVRWRPTQHQEHQQETFMKLKLAALALAVTTATSGAFAADPHHDGRLGVKVGVLRCDIEGGVGFVIGSSKRADCTFKRSHGGTEHYSGTVGNLGLDIGITNDTVLGWVVFAPGKLRRGALKGSYTGAGAEATIGLGVGANLLVGGFKKGINLQPLSLQAQSGLNIAAGVKSLHLSYSH